MIKQLQTILSHKRTPIYLGVFLIVLPLILFFPVLFHDFISDDYIWLGWIHKLNTSGTPLWDIFFTTSLHHNNYYRPLLLLSFFIDFKIAGLSEFYYYFYTLILNGLNLSLLYWLTYSLIKNSRRIKIIGGLATSAIFLVLPVHTDSLMWIAERTDVLATTFSLLTLLTLLYYRKHAHKYWLYSVSIFLLVFFTLLTKEVVGISLMAAILFIDLAIVPWKKMKKFKYWSLYGFVGLPVIIYMIMRLLAYGTSNLGVALAKYDFSNTVKYFKYLRYPLITNEWLGYFAIALILVTLFYLFRRNKKLTFALIGWFIISNAVTLLTTPGIARWRLYFPSVALALLIGIGYSYAQKKTVNDKFSSRPVFFRSLISIILIVSLSTSLITLWRQMGEWRLATKASKIEVETLITKVDELSCYSYILLINQVHSVSVGNSFTFFGEKTVAMETNRESALRIYLGDAKYETIPTILPVSTISIGDWENSASAAVFVDDHTLDVSARYVSLRKKEGIFKSERIGRTATRLTNRITLAEGLTFSDFGVLEYLNGTYIDHSVACPK